MTRLEAIQLCSQFKNDFYIIFSLIALHRSSKVALLTLTVPISLRASLLGFQLFAMKKSNYTDRIIMPSCFIFIVFLLDEVKLNILIAYFSMFPNLLSPFVVQAMGTRMHYLVNSIKMKLNTCSGYDELVRM